MLKIPAHFFEVRYVGDRYPGNADGLEAGANCQHFCFELLRHFGFEIGNLRSSNLWEDEIYTEIANSLQPLDLILFNKSEDPYGAHVGICIGNNQILHLSKKEGVPVVWELSRFSLLEEYSTIIGIKRPKKRAANGCV